MSTLQQEEEVTAASEDVISSIPMTELPDTVGTEETSQVTAWNNKHSQKAFEDTLTYFNGLLERYEPLEVGRIEYRRLGSRTGDLPNIKGSMRFLKKAIDDTQIRDFRALIAKECSSWGGSGSGPDTIPYITREQWESRRKTMNKKGE